MSEFEALAEKAEKDFDLGEFARAVRACRSYRRFDEGDPIPEALLIGLVDLARVVASGANRMPLRYRIVSAAAERDTVFAQLKWAGALPEWDGPEPGERPTGYIVVCDAGHGATTPVDEGIAAQTEQSCKNVGAILEAAGSGYDKVIKTTCFLADIADFAAFNEVYAKYFTSKPARSCVAVKDLPKGVLCEIEAVAEA